MSTKIRLTNSDLALALSHKGTLNKAQFQALGYQGTFKGWKKVIVNSYYHSYQIDNFISLKNAHLKPKKKTKKLSERKLRPLDILDDTREGYDSPQWNELRRQIYRRDGFRCRACGKAIGKGSELHAHHLLYEKGKEVWDVPDWYLITLCKSCHTKEHSKELRPPTKHF